MKTFKKIMQVFKGRDLKNTAVEASIADSEVENNITLVSEVKARDFLNPELSTPITFKYPSKEGIYEKYMTGDLAQIWRNTPDGHKWLNYFQAYEKLFSSFRGRKIKVLEIGVKFGGSLTLWREYFGMEAILVGIDITTDCQKYEDPDNGIFVRIGDQSDAKFLESVMEEFGPFDIIIDDGSHVVSHQIASFNALFLRGLNTGGIYLVEDLETSHWGDRTGQKDIEINFHQFTAAIVDLMHETYTTRLYANYVIEDVVGKDTELPMIATIVDEIRFFESIVAFCRNDALPPVVENLTK